jgi:hypothetical protein
MAVSAQRPLSSEEMERMIFDALYDPAPFGRWFRPACSCTSSRTFLAGFDQTMKFEFKTVISNSQHATAALLAQYLARRRQIAEPAA